ncbi:hypothetical protein BC938DRAFT_480589 [Jimgerdemannia flammicorona]|uniref:Uncharacterized protein n=1 Tax=Jimgerdemannia flammicorona TaxID=994334 RepID=A0A433QX74_9FUNG|nr:hypothetical protein BC938DRAFT_480589 [Jimgerdemannia flammicorona]
MEKENPIPPSPAADNRTSRSRSTSSPRIRYITRATLIRFLVPKFEQCGTRHRFFIDPTYIPILTTVPQITRIKERVEEKEGIPPPQQRYVGFYTGSGESMKLFLRKLYFGALRCTCDKMLYCGRML